MLLFNSINSLLLLTFFSIISVNEVSSVDYCSKKLCGGKKHIACGNDGSFGPKCPKDATVVPMKDLKAFIVEKHNEIRKDVCAGNYKGLKNANRMIELVN